MWITLNFTPLYQGALFIGLVLVAAGWLVREYTAPGGWVVMVLGAILGLFGGGLLTAEAWDRRRLERQGRVVDEVLRQDRIVNGMALPKGTSIRWKGDDRELYQLV